MAFDFTGTMIKDEYEGFKTFMTKQKDNVNDIVTHLTGKIKRLENKATSIQMPQKLLVPGDKSRTAPLPANDGVLQKLLRAQDAFYEGPVEPFVKPAKPEQDPQTKALSNKIPIPLDKSNFQDAATGILVWKGLKQPTLPAVKTQRDNMDADILRIQDVIEQLRIDIILLQKFSTELTKIDKLIQKQFNEPQAGPNTVFGVKLQSLSSTNLNGLKKHEKERIIKTHGDHLSILTEKDQGKEQILPRSGYYQNNTQTTKKKK